ncbi:MAG: SpoIIE family protein phosphatase [Desulfotomaculaceae bacterium]|nr:SpoIIE family protein phosphatase [Desulfotomaculaceae bacterium]
MKKAKWLYIEDAVFQVNKRDKRTCGDFYLCQRTYEHTIFILCDGIGSGIKANLAATMCANRLLFLLDAGVSLFRTCEMVLSMMHKAHTEEDIPYAAFSIAWILNNGQYTIISYESPVPLLVNGNSAEPVLQRSFILARELVGESTGVLRDGETLVLMSDGITQAGLGRIPGLGWGTEGVNSFFNYNLYRDQPLVSIARAAIDKAGELSGGYHPDDTSIAILSCRQANVLNIMTGPAAHKRDDQIFVADFMNSSGYKAVCGSTTADVVARVLKLPVEATEISEFFSQPPLYKIKGIDLVTEGAVTLNQVFNILDEDPEEFDSNSCVSDLARMMLDADIIKFFIGEARNPSHAGISFKQMGVLPRHTIINLLIQKLTEKGKIILQYHK